MKPMKPRKALAPSEPVAQSETAGAAAAIERLADLAGPDVEDDDGVPTAPGALDDWPLAVDATRLAEAVADVEEPPTAPSALDEAMPDAPAPAEPTLTTSQAPNLAIALGAAAVGAGAATWAVAGELVDRHDDTEDQGATAALPLAETPEPLAPASELTEQPAAGSQSVESEPEREPEPEPEQSALSDPGIPATETAPVPAPTALVAAVPVVPMAPAQPAMPAGALFADRPSATEVPVRSPDQVDWLRFQHQMSLPLEEPAAARPAMGSVRVRAALLDRLVGHAGEVSMARARIEADVNQFRSALGDLNENLERLRAQLRAIELQAETQIASRLEAARAAQQQFDPLEMDRFTRFQELTRMMAESVSDVATVQRGLQRTLQSTEDQLAQQHRMSRDMQDDLLRTRLVEFEGLSERLYRVVRQAAKETGKPVRLDIVGGSIEVDRGGARPHDPGLRAPAAQQRGARH